MQREAARRGFVINHQKVVVDIDLAGFMRGYTEITLIPTSNALRTIHLHSRECDIHSVSIGGKRADFVLQDPLSSIGPSKPDDVHSFNEIKRRLFSALSEADEGELSIAIPEECIPALSSPGGPQPSQGTNPPTSSTSNPSGSSTSEFAPIVLTIDYSLRNPRDGIQFVLPTDAYPYRVPHAYTTPASPDSARCWVPCVDNIWERVTWDFELIVPKSLGGREPDDMDVDGLTEEEVPVVVVCTGDLVEKVAHPHDSRKSIFVYSQSSPTSVQHVAFAVGPFHVHAIPAETAPRDGTTSELSSGLPVSSQTPMHVFCLPGLETSLEVTTSFYRSAMNFFTSEYGSYPFGSHKLVFVDEMPTQRFEAATMSLVSNDLLHGEDAIDQVFDTRQSLSHALACQWVGINIIPKTWADLWLVDGLGLYITALFIRRLFGNNEYRFRLRKDMDRVVALDIGSMPPICRPTVLDPPDSNVLTFINLKAPIVLYMLDRKLGKSGTSLGLSRVLPKIFLSAISGEMTNNMISTHSFLRTCRKVSAVDVRSFADQWIYGSGYPTFTFTAHFNKKKMAVELYMTQYCVAHRYNETDPVSLALLKPVQAFEGTMTLRIHEADGTPYEHVLDIRNSQKRYEILFNTKYKRVRRNTKRYLARKAAAAAAEAGDPEAAEAMEMIDSGFELKLWEDEGKRAWWMVTDWTEEDEKSMNNSAYEWIRLDADFEWIAAMQFDQPDFMWVSQLQRDRDVVAQLEALQALARQPTAVASSNLTKTVLVANYFFRIRAEAAMLLTNCATPALKNIGLMHMFKLFSLYCHKPQTLSDPLRAKFVPKANDFTDFAEYFVRKSLITAIAAYRDAEGKTGPIVRRFLIDQLRYNDNAKNPYSDALYVCTIIAGLARTMLPERIPQQSELSTAVWVPDQDDEDREVLDLAVAEVERYREMDRLNPSHHNVISIAILEWNLSLQLGAILPMDWRMFVAYSREGNYGPVRAAAFEALLLNKWFSRKSLARYIYAVIANDPSRMIRRFVARGVIASLGILESIGDIKVAAKGDSKSILIEEDGSVPPSTKQGKKGEVEMALKAIRKEAGKLKGVRDIFVPTFLSASTDHEIRWTLLKLGELLFRSEPEQMPKVSFKLPKAAPIVVDDILPPTPIQSIPAPEPSIAEVVGPPPPIGQPTQRSPLKRKPSPARSHQPLPPVLPETPIDPSFIDVESTGLATDVLSLPPAVPKHVPTPKIVTFDAKPAPLPKKKKEKPVPKSQTSGMSAKDVQACRNILKRLISHKSSFVFRQPVDPVRDKAIGYFDVISHPMDLSAMGSKLDHGKYASRSEFQSDFKLMIANAQKYNGPGSYVYVESEVLDAYFDKVCLKVSATLEALAHPKEVLSTEMPAILDAPAPAPPSDPVPVPPVDAPTTAVSPTIKTKASSLPKVSPPTNVPEPIPAPNPVPPIPEVKPNITPTAPTVLAAAPAPPRPTLKFKVSKDKGSQGTPPVTTPVKVETPPVRKPRPVVNPPAPVASSSIDVALTASVDDLLAEEIDEIEAQKQKSTPANGKKKSKEKVKVKEKTTTPAPRTILPDVSRSSRPSTPVVAPPVKAPPVKVPPLKKTGTSITIKGKERETSESGTPIDAKKCREVLKHVTDRSRVPEVWLFLVPVDPVAAGCPTYYDEIKHPMDFQTMLRKLNKGEYRTMEAFADDVNLIFKNCRQFNPPGTEPTFAADAVEKAFKAEWKRVTQKKIPPSERKTISSLLAKLREVEHYVWFKEPVNTVIFTDYNTTVPKKDMRDINGIKAKLDADKYESIEDVLADFTQLAKNAVKYNGAEDPVAKLAKQLEGEVGASISQLKKKRKSSGDDSGGGGGASSSKVGANGGRANGNGPVKKMKFS